ncbi:type 2 lanthipeptide synthetase LanM family protein [Lysobacter enzymogenes]|uniref:type 2 lanthipeptide synthetase LanM family protein n=1 Tax=Lysobacter enzymogenes TaxID=69 RepID=UPI003748D346
MTDAGSVGGFAPIVEHFCAAARDRLAASLAQLAPALDPEEIRLIRDAAVEALHANARLKLNRVLLLELYAAKCADELGGGDDAARFERFVQRCRQGDFGRHLDRRYPNLRARLARVLDEQCGGTTALAARLARDRAALAPLLGGDAGRLSAIALGLGDLHAHGQAVARLSFEGGQVMYKPRSLRVDAALDRFLQRLFPADPHRIRVPAVVDRGDYGWAEHVAHRYCDGDGELRRFYAGLGQWLAVLRLLGGTDIHLENLIAVGPTPVVVDVESLFAHTHATAPSGYGHAHDLARELIRSSVLRTGIVPSRAPTLGFDNVDLSAAGALPGEQPRVLAPVIAGEGTTDAHVEIISVEVGLAQNHPSPQPELSRYWDGISSAFLDTSERLRRLDADGALAPLIGEFVGCSVRDIRRTTKAYLEIGRMLWHPASLHDEAKAVARARDLFVRNAAVMPAAPSSVEEIDREIDDLRHADIPVFASSLTPQRVDAALAGWRAMRIDLEEMTIRSALVVTELNHRANAPMDDSQRRYHARRPHADDLERRRRTLAAQAVERLLSLAVYGDDRSATWITPGASSVGWHVHPLQSDIYSGLGGVAVALAGYRREVGHGRADPVAGTDEAIDGALRVLARMAAGERLESAGGFSGYGSRIWSWLLLHDLLERPELLEHALAYAGRLEAEGFDADRSLDLIDGCSGAIVPLLGLAQRSGDPRWLELAARAGRHLESMAIVDERGARWPAAAFAEPVGGFAHGAVGIAWSLTRLALAGAGSAGDRQRWSALAEAGFAFQDGLFDASSGNWREAISGKADIHTWCGGSVGIGLAAADLYARTAAPRHLRDLRRAVAASQGYWGLSHTLCHGDFSLWALLARASALDPDCSANDCADATAQVVSALEEHHGMVGGMTREAFTPGLMTGLAGAVHGLAGMHPHARPQSPLLLECG